MINKNDREKGKMQVLCIDQLVPQEHLVRRLESAINFDFIYDEVKHLYSEDNGRPGIDPVTLFKLVFVQYMFGIRSMRQTIKEIETNMAYRWFCNLDFFDSVPHFTTFGKNYERRFKNTDIFQKIFDTILNKAIEHGFVDTTSIFIDSTHIKASANKRKKIEAFIKKETKSYESKLNEEINEERNKLGKKNFEDKDDDLLHKITTSTTDPESGEFHKGEHEKCFAYSAHTACDRKGFVLKTKVTPSNTHDSRVFSDVYQDVISKHEVENVAVDAGYKTVAIAKEIIDSGKTPIMPYSRQKGGSKPAKDGFSKKDFMYDKEKDIYISPDGEVFKLATIDRKGYRQYKGKGKSRVITRHIWQDNLDKANEIRLTEHGKAVYKERKETIERVFGDAKEKHAMRWTTLRGLSRIQTQVTITFTCINLKKLANWMSKLCKKINISLKTMFLLKISSNSI